MGMCDVVSLSIQSAADEVGNCTECCAVGPARTDYKMFASDANMKYFHNVCTKVFPNSCRAVHVSGHSIFRSPRGGSQRMEFVNAVSIHDSWWNGSH